MTRGVALSLESQNEVCDMFTGGMKVSEIAAETGFAAQTIYRVLRARNVMESETNDAGHLNDETVCKIVDDYVADRPVEQIFAEYRISPNTLYSILREADIPTRAEKAEATRQKRLDDAIEMYLRNELIYTICRVCGISTFTLNQEIHKRGIPLRRQQKPRNG